MTTIPTSLPAPLRWQRDALAQDRELMPKLTVAAVGRRSGKSFFGLQYLAFAPGGLVDGRPVCWASTTDAALSDIREVFRNWFAEMIVSKTPDGTGFVLCNGGKIEFASLAPGHNAFRGKGYSLACIDECSFVRNLTVTIERNLTPALSQYAGRLLLISSPFGYNEFYDWFRIAERDGVAINGSSRLNETLPAGAIEEERRILTPLAFEAEIEGRFCALEGTCMKKSEIRYGPLPSREEMVYLSIGLDLAISEKKSADYTAICVCAVDDRGRRWVCHMAQWRSRWVDTVQKLLGYVQAWSPNIIVMESVATEGGGCGRAAARVRAADSFD